MTETAARPYRVTVLVLGDLGRSPRMLNHALALAEYGAWVSLAGYGETPVEAVVAQHPRIHCWPIRSPRRAPEEASHARFLLATLWRVIFLQVQLLRLLLARIPKADAVLVQNPPSVPTLPVAWLAARLRGSRFIIDWHNFGYSMLGLRLGARHFAVGMAKRLERFFARRADAHFCVSLAMKQALEKDFRLVSPVVLYDRPRVIERGRPIAERSGPAAMIICPTGWTADEDTDLLLKALRRWDAAGAAKILVLITGRGPRRAQFEEKIRDIYFRRLEIRTLFLDMPAYRELLRTAHLGVSVHRSSSGVDLAMKVVDLFGARTPVCALDYGPCLREQIEPGRTGELFSTSEELAGKLSELLEGRQALEEMRLAIEQSWSVTWNEEWQRVAAPIFGEPILRHNQVKKEKL